MEAATSRLPSCCKRLLDLAALADPTAPGFHRASVGLAQLQGLHMSYSQYYVDSRAIFKMGPHRIRYRGYIKGLTKLLM